jgi:hypothetical protein
MGLASWLGLEGKDIVAFMFASLLGFLAGTLVPAGWWAVYASILVSYHVFLAWLVLTADHEVGVSLRPASTIVTHLACLAVVLPLGMGQHFIPFFGLFRYTIAALAIFERGWLFSGNSSRPKNPDLSSNTPIVNSTSEDYQEWLSYLAEQKPASRKLGTSLKAEYEQWLLTRPQSRPAEPSSDLHTGGQ